MASPVSVVVHGLSGSVGTVNATVEWSVEQVREAILQELKLGIANGRLVLVNGLAKLAPQVLLGSLLSDSKATVLELTLVIHQVPHGFVDFVGCCNGLEQVQPGHLIKRRGVSFAATASAVSSEGFEVKMSGGVRFRPARVDKLFMIGLGGEKEVPADPHEIDFAVYCGVDSCLNIIERGIWRHTTTRKCSPTSLIELRVTDKVDYYLENQLEFSSCLKGQETLYAMASFAHLGGEAMEIQWL